MQINYYEKDKLLIFKINEEIDECSVKNTRYIKLPYARDKKYKEESRLWNWKIYA